MDSCQSESCRRSEDEARSYREKKQAHRRQLLSEQSHQQRVLNAKTETESLQVFTSTHRGRKRSGAIKRSTTFSYRHIRSDEPEFLLCNDSNKNQYEGRIKQTCRRLRKHKSDGEMFKRRKSNYGKSLLFFVSKQDDDTAVSVRHGSSKLERKDRHKCRRISMSDILGIVLDQSNSETKENVLHTKVITKNSRERRIRQQQMIIENEAMQQQFKKIENCKNAGVHTGLKIDGSEMTEHSRKLLRVNKLETHIRRVEPILSILLRDSVLEVSAFENIRANKGKIRNRLLDYVATSSVSIYRKFLDALDETNQHYLRQFLENYDCNIDASHQETLRVNHQYVVNNICLKTSLLSYLFQRGILDSEEIEQIRNEETHSAGVRQMLDFLFRSSHCQYNIFLQSLCDSNHEFVFRHLTDMRNTQVHAFKSKKTNKIHIANQIQTDK